MANKNLKNIKDNGIKAQAKVVNKVALSVGEDLVNLTLKGAETSQRVFGKVVEGGVTIFGMQQKFALDTLEKVVTNKQLKSLVKLPANYFNRFLTTAEERVDELREDTVDVLNDVKKVISKKPAKKVKKVKKAVAKKVTAKKVIAKKVAKKVVAKKVTKKDNLTTIKGIGPKASAILTKAGYGSFASIAKASKKDLEMVLTAAGTRYARLNPTPWIKEAKKLAK
jgi:predicted flap endonuclease-1-like 5' DNA nuclease